MDKLNQLPKWIVVALLGLCIAACGTVVDPDAQDDQETTQPEPEPEPEPTPEPEPEPERSANRYDIVYASEIVVRSDGTGFQADGMAVIVATGERRVLISDHAVTAPPELGLNLWFYNACTSCGSDRYLDPGRWYGYANPQLLDVIVDNEMIEGYQPPTGLPGRGYNAGFSYLVPAGLPAKVTTVQVAIDLVIDGVDIRLPVTVHLVPANTNSVDILKVSYAESN